MHWDIHCDDVQRCNIKVLSVLLERLSARDAVGSAVVVAVVVLGVEAALAICCILSICQYALLTHTGQLFHWWRCIQH